MVGQMMIRMADERDFEALQELMAEYIVDFYGSAHPGEDKLCTLIRMLLERREGIQFVMEEAGRITGFATLYFTYSTLRACKVLVLNDLYLKEHARGTGAAQALFDACRSYGLENGFESMSWETARSNQRAQAFYARMGGIRGDWLNYSLRLV